MAKTKPLKNVVSKGFHAVYLHVDGSTVMGMKQWRTEDQAIRADLPPFCKGIIGTVESTMKIKPLPKEAVTKQPVFPKEEYVSPIYKVGDKVVLTNSRDHNGPEVGDTGYVTLSFMYADGRKMISVAWDNFLGGWKTEHCNCNGWSVEEGDLYPVPFPNTNTNSSPVVSSRSLRISSFHKREDFKPTMKVEVAGGHYLAGLKGEVRFVETHGVMPVVVEFREQWSPMHNCHGKVPSGLGFFFDPSDLLIEA